MSLTDDLPAETVLRLLAADRIRDARRHTANNNRAEADKARAEARELFEKARAIEHDKLAAGQNKRTKKISDI
jgi:hypothetical protein